MKQFIDSVRAGEKGFYIRNSVFFPFHFDLLSIWLGKEMSLLSAPEIITDITNPDLIVVREGACYTNIVFRKWGDLGKELGNHKGHIILHVVEKHADPFLPENRRYIKVCFRDMKTFRDLDFEIVEDPLYL